MTDDGDEIDAEIERAAKLRGKRKGGEDMERNPDGKGGNQWGREPCPLGCGAEIKTLPGHLPDCPEA